MDLCFEENKKKPRNSFIRIFSNEKRLSSIADDNEDDNSIVPAEFIIRKRFSPFFRIILYFPTKKKEKKRK